MHPSVNNFFLETTVFVLFMDVLAYFIKFNYRTSQFYSSQNSLVFLTYEIAYDTIIFWTNFNISDRRSCIVLNMWIYIAGTLKKGRQIKIRKKSRKYKLRFSSYTYLHKYHFNLPILLYIHISYAFCNPTTWNDTMLACYRMFEYLNFFIKINLFPFVYLRFFKKYFC